MHRCKLGRSVRKRERRLRPESTQRPQHSCCQEFGACFGTRTLSIHSSISGFQNRSCHRRVEHSTMFPWQVSSQRTPVTSRPGWPGETYASNMGSHYRCAHHAFDGYGHRVRPSAGGVVGPRICTSPSNHRTRRSGVLYCGWNLCASNTHWKSCLECDQLQGIGWFPFGYIFLFGSLVYGCSSVQFSCVCVCCFTLPIHKCY